MTNSVIILLLKAKFQKLLLKIMKQASQQKLITSTTLEDYILECTENATEKLADELSAQYPTIKESKDYLFSVNGSITFKPLIILKSIVFRVTNSTSSTSAVAAIMESPKESILFCRKRMAT